MTDSEKTTIYRYIFLTILLLAVYGNILNHGFVWDDVEIMVVNPRLEKLTNIPMFFLMEDTAGGPTGYYRPITYVSFALDRAIWGVNPVGFNITNLVLHILVALLFYRVVFALFKRENLAFVAALIFSLHPIVGESVNFHAGGRNTLLSACFALASLLSYVNRRWLLAVLFFSLAIFSKEFALLLPVLFLLYDKTIDSEEKANWKGYLPYLAVIICYLALRSFAVMHGNLLKTINIVDNFWIVPQTIISYLQLMVFPLNVKTLYDVNNQITWTSFISYTLLLLVIIGIAIVFRRKREILFAVTMFLLFLLPVTNLFSLGTAMMADRYAYFSLFGFSLALAYLICLLKKQIGIAVMVVLCGVYITVDIKRNGIWKNEITLFTQMVKDAPEVCVGYLNLGYAYNDSGDHANAAKYLAAAQHKKDLTGKLLFFSAVTLWELHQPEKALAALDETIDLEPNNYRPYMMASMIYEEMGNTQMAKMYYDKGLALYRGTIEALRQSAISIHRQGEAMMANGDFIKAERYFYEALSLDPRYVPAMIEIGNLAAQKDNMAKSLHYFSKAASLEPLNPTAYYNLSMVYEALGEKRKAQEAINRFRELEAGALQKGATARQ